MDRLADDLHRFLAVTGLGGGSNNWAVAASRTATGRPMLANDRTLRRAPRRTSAHLQEMLGLALHHGRVCVPLAQP